MKKEGILKGVVEAVVAVVAVEALIVVVVVVATQELLFLLNMWHQHTEQPMLVQAPLLVLLVLQVAPLQPLHHPHLLHQKRIQTHIQVQVYMFHQEIHIMVVLTKVVVVVDPLVEL